MKVWFCVGDCGEDPDIRWESLDMTLEYAYLLAEDFRSSPDPVPVRNYIDETGRAHMLIAEADDLESFRQFIKTQTKGPP